MPHRCAQVYPLCTHVILSGLCLESPKIMETPGRPAPSASRQEENSTNLLTACTASVSPQRDDSACFFSKVEDCAVLSGDPSTTFDDPPWNPDQPTTWPILHLPFHDGSDTCRPTHIDDLTHHVHYKGAGAAALRMLLFEELCGGDRSRETGDRIRGIFVLAIQCDAEWILERDKWYDGRRDFGLERSEEDRSERCRVETGRNVDQYGRRCLVEGYRGVWKPAICG